MSILIKGTEMPENCLVCFVPCSLLCDLDDYDRKRIRHPECPCVEIPTPHGRLIDYDQLIETLNTKIPDKFDADINYFLRHAPTVIDKE